MYRISYGVCERECVCRIRGYLFLVYFFVVFFFILLMDRAWACKMVGGIFFFKNNSCLQSLTFCIVFSLSRFSSFFVFRFPLLFFFFFLLRSITGVKLNGRCFTYPRECFFFPPLISSFSFKTFFLIVHDFHFLFFFCYSVLSSFRTLSSLFCSFQKWACSSISYSFPLVTVFYTFLPASFVLIFWHCIFISIRRTR